MSEALHPEEVVTSIVLVRHGHTAQTEGGMLYSDPAAMLTDKGREQAKAAAAYLTKEKPDLLLTSPSQRVRDTAEIIAGQLNLSAGVFEKLHEWQVGQWEGRSYLDIKKSQPELYKDWTADPIRNAPPGGESIEGLYDRARECLDELLKNHGGKHIILVTHAEVVRALFVHALGMPIDNFWRVSVPTGSISKIDFSPSFATLQYAAVRP